MSGYSKLFSSILASTIWEADMPTRIVWITLLAMSNAKGKVEGSVPGLATFARVPLEQCRAALANLKAPDPDSRSKEHEGRRIMDIEGGWFIINYKKYRDQLNQEERREYLRVKQAEYRGKQKSTIVDDVSDKSTRLTQAEAEAEAEASTTTPLPPSRSKPIRPAAPQALTDTFNAFWLAYPKKVGKGAALKAWTKLKPSQKVCTRMLEAIAEQSVSDQWQKDRGQFIPHPATWLNQGRWDDEPIAQTDVQPSATRETRPHAAGQRPYVSSDADWWDECKIIHNGACDGDRMRHHLRVQTDRVKAANA